MVEPGDRLDAGDGDRLPPGAHRRSPGRTRRTVGLILLFVLLAAFALVMARRTHTRRNRIGRAEQRIRDDSMAFMIMNARPWRALSRHVKFAELDRAMDCMNAANEAAEAACDAWNRAFVMLPHGKVTTDMAFRMLARGGSYGAALRDADDAIARVGTQAEEIRLTSLAPGVEAQDIDRISTAVNALRDRLQTVSRYMWQQDRLRDEYLQAAVNQDTYGAKDAVDSLNVIGIKAVAARRAISGANDTLMEVAKSLFDIVPAE